jgi:chromosome segregation ATPase
MEQYPSTYRGGRWVRGSNNLQQAVLDQLKAQRDTLRAQLTTVNTRRDTLRNSAPGQRLGPATERDKLARTITLEVLGELRDAVDAATKRYEELSRNAEVQRALKSVGQVSLVPSEEHLGNVRALKQFERLFDPKHPTPKLNIPSRKSVKSKRAGR